MSQQIRPETDAEAVVDALGLCYHDDLDPDDFMLFPTTDQPVIEAEKAPSDWQATYGGRDAFECLVRTILSQNTSDVASQPAHEALIERYGGDLCTNLATADLGELAETIQSAGLYNQKAAKIIGAAEWVLAEFDSAAAFDEFVSTGKADEIRKTLLEVDGVGPKTADCVLLFAGGSEGVFPVDTHVHRIARRIGLAPVDGDHETVREHLERDVPPEKCGFGHTAMIQFGREYCTSRNPVCLDDPEACPLFELCERNGVTTDEA